jgi:ATP-dependent Clp protease ATP-binding subunit ClpC
MKKLSLGATVAWDISVQEAVASKRQFIEKEHLFVALLSLDKILLFTPEQLGVNKQDRDSLSSEHAALDQVLGGLKVDRVKLRREIRNRFGTGNTVQTENVVHRSDKCKAVFSQADELCSQEANTTSLHLFATLLEMPGPVIAGVLKDLGINLAELQEQILSTGNPSPVEKREEERDKNPLACQPRERITPCLDRYGRDLMAEAREGRLGPFLGRRKELLQIAQALARSSKNNPVLVGEAGVGKTALVEALALRAIQGKDPEVLSGKRFVELNIEALTGGSKRRGEFEERLTQVIQEVRNNPHVIVFIDEFHNLIGAGRAEGSADAANLLKPALASGDFRCICTTTTEEYRHHIECDAALERRFVKITIPEPTRDETIEMLRGVRSRLEKHHAVCISDRAVEASVDFSIRFDVDHRLPDKAIDLLDKAGSRTRVPILSMMPGGEIGDLDQKGMSEVTEMTIAQVLSEKMGIPLERIIGSVAGKFFGSRY